MQFEDLCQAVNDLASGNWNRAGRKPMIDLGPTPTLWPIPLKDRLKVIYPPKPNRWESNPELTLDWTTDAPLGTPLISELNSRWLAPCHALFSIDEEVLASISGVLTFIDWIEPDEYQAFFDPNSVEDLSPMIVALDSSLGFRRERDQPALENAARIIMNVQPAEAERLILALQIEREVP
jgi:hypothetical protein